MSPPPRFTSKRTLAPQKAPGLYLSTYEPELGAAICRRVAAGESLRSICRDDASMPTGKTVWNWRRAHEEFRLMLDHAQGVARARSLAAQVEGDAARRAARAAARRFKGRAPTRFSDAAWDEIRARLMGGEGLTAICRRAHLPSVGTVYNWMRADPALAAAYRRAKTFTLDGVLEKHCAHLPWMGMRKSEPMLNRAVRAGEREAARLKLKRYAPARGPETLTVVVEDPDGSRRVIYGPGAETQR